MNQEIIFKICKTCNEEKESTKYRPFARECKKCNNKKDAFNNAKRTKTFYVNHREEMSERYLLEYYKNKYNNKNLTMHEVNLFRISV